jgi:hypothetical protein
MNAFIFVLSASLMLLCGCAVSPTKADGAPIPQRDGQAPTTHEWRTGLFHVLFSAGPVEHLSDGNRRTFSTYQVRHQVEGEPATTAIAESAQDVEVFLHSPDNKFEEIIRVFSSASSRTLLIAEDVINDCCPCSNFILFKISGDEIKIAYLDMPTWTPAVPAGMPRPIFPEYPNVRRITDEQVEFEFSNKESRRLEFRGIRKLSGVRFPG